jgi:hypothetical protein
METLVLDYDKEEDIVYTKIFPTFSVIEHFDVSKIDEYRYVEEISWKNVDKKVILPETGDTLVIRYTFDTGDPVLKYLIKTNGSTYRCIRINETIYLIYCGNELESENQE